MIDRASLTTADIGRWVIYSAHPSHRERGRLKSWTNNFLYVVFRCGDWDDFDSYTAAPTLPEHLDFETQALEATSQ